MTSALLGGVVAAVLFAVFGLLRRERECRGACPGCGDDCSRRIRPGRHLREVGRGET